MPESLLIVAAILDSQNLRELEKGGRREKTPTRKGCENGHGSKTAGHAQKEPCLFSPFDFQNGGRRITIQQVIVTALRGTTLARDLHKRLNSSDLHKHLCSSFHSDRRNRDSVFQAMNTSPLRGN